MRGNKKGQVPGTSKRKKKSETRGKNGQVSDSRISGVYYPPEKKERKIAHVLPKQRSKKRRDSNMRSNEK